MVYKLRAYELPSILDESGSYIPENISKDTILWQCLIDKLMEEKLDEEISKHRQSRKTKIYRRLSYTEENAIRYAAGYIVRKLINRKNKTLNDCVDGLKSLLVQSETTDLDESVSFLEYTSIWLSKVDRGGLYHVTDMCFQIFSEVELCVYEGLHKKRKIVIEELKNDVCSDSDVLQLWNLHGESISLPVEHRKIILEHIVREWIILRGHSMTSKIMEQYKKVKDRGSVSKKGIREQLKKKHTM